MASEADIEGLLERVRRATGPDREIDARLAELLGWTKAPPPRDTDRMFPSLWVNPAGAVCGALPPHWTGSLDAIVGLIEREFPGWRGDVDIGASFSDGTFGARLFPPDSLFGNEAEDGATPALALCAAFLAAKLSQAKS